VPAGRRALNLIPCARARSALPSERAPKARKAHRTCAPANEAARSEGPGRPRSVGQIRPARYVRKPCL
jgi:hypothetical protein